MTTKDQRPTTSLVLRFQRVVSYDAEAGDADVSDGDPAFELVVVGAVQQVGEADGGQRCGSFQAGECRGVIDDVVGDQNFFASAGQEVAGGSVVEAAEDGDAGEQQNVGAVPEGVRRVLGRGVGKRSGRGNWVGLRAARIAELAPDWAAQEATLSRTARRTDSAASQALSWDIACRL